MNRMTQTINTRMSSEDDDFAATFSKRYKVKPRRHSSDAHSLWTRFVSWLNSLFICRLPSICKRDKTHKNDTNKGLQPQSSLSGIHDRNWSIIKAANLPVIWIMSGPGVPVEALIARLAQIYNFQHVNVGQMLRSEISKGTNRPELGKKLMERGVVIPRRFLNDMIKRYMAKTIKEKKVQGFLFSDFPTTFSQSKAFTSSISAVDYIMVLKFDDHTMKLCAYELLHQQTRSSKTVCKSKSDLKTSVEELLSKYHADLRSMERVHGHKMKLIDAELQIREVCRIIMTWIERAMLTCHDIQPPKSVEVPVQENYNYSY